MAKTRVRDWMHVGVVTCRPNTPVAEVADIMKTQDVSALVVVNDDGYAVGVISRIDLVNASFVQPYLRRWLGMAAQHLMSSPIISVRAEDPVEKAVRLLRERKIHRLVVTEPEGDRERPVGILSVTDLVRYVAEA